MWYNNFFFCVENNDKFIVTSGKNFLKFKNSKEYSMIGYFSLLYFIIWQVTTNITHIIMVIFIFFILHVDMPGKGIQNKLYIFSGNLRKDYNISFGFSI